MATRRFRTYGVVALLILAFAAGLILGRGGSGPPAPAHPMPAAAEIWTCSMHPQIQQPEFGACPICGMDLIPAGDGGGASAGELTLTESARRLAEIEVATVEHRSVAREIRLVGKIDYDESRVTVISARFPGRLDRLFVNYTGIPVREGDHLAELYSPELLTAQEELIQAVRAGGANETRRANRDAAREKLRLWGLTAGQITQIEERREPSERVTIYAPQEGIVMEKPGIEGMYVEVGTPIYRIADLSQVWVKLDAYESDIAWIRYGQTVEIRAEAYPGETFHGRVVFIDPVLDPRTRTVKVRVNVPNPDGRLKPEMFVSAVIESRLAAGGTVLDPDLAGKWISPMHPEVIKDEPGPCDVCGMPLVRAEELGHVAVEGDPPLVIPASAPLITGKRAVVYVADPAREGTYRGREVRLGPRAGEVYLVQDGLEEGEEVVVRGNFKIDSAIQIMAGPSMMSHTGQVEQEREALEVPAAFNDELDRVLAIYFDIQQSLSRDRREDVSRLAERLVEAVAAVDGSPLSARARRLWHQDARALRQAADRIGTASELAAAREAFEPLSTIITGVVRSYGSSSGAPVLRFHCPMAFDWKGADWLQNKPGVENPYFGSGMFRCGTEEETLYVSMESAGHDD